jgi:hypothetical protein
METELYTLNSLFQRERVFDRFISLIWTERFQELGDIELILESTTENKKYFTRGTWMAINKSHRCMRVDTTEDTIDDEGRKILRITGPSMEVLLDERAALPILDTSEISGNWTITGTPDEIALAIFNIIGAIDVKDQLPNYWDSAIFPADSIPFPTTETTMRFEFDTVYTGIKKVCEAYDMGLRLVRNGDTSEIAFHVYMGSDRTTNQTTLEPIVFSPSFDNLRNITELKSSAGTRNVAYVSSAVGSAIVIPDDVDPDISGADRKVLMVNADDITDPVPASATAKMIKRGLEELAKYRDVQALDGEISQNSTYVYDTDYYLGDIVEMRDPDDGTANFMRVTEQIFVSDEQGDRSYPTLTVKKLITPDSWLGWPNQTWLDLDSDPLVWADA